MKITIEPEIPLKLGLLRLSECQIAASGSALSEIYDESTRVARERFATTPLSEHPVAAGVRGLFKSVGIDPSRYRPSGEALVRRVLKGQELYKINCIVDINNICSIESLFPIGTYNCGEVIGDVNIRLGSKDEVYRGIGKEINIAGKLVSFDREGAFGSPIADSDRTKISENVHEILVLLYAPDSTDDGEIHETLNRFANLASTHAGAQVEDLRIYPNS